MLSMSATPGPHISGFIFCILALISVVFTCSQFSFCYKMHYTVQHTMLNAIVFQAQNQ